MKFSERMGFISVSDVIQVDGMNDSLRNGIWNVFYIPIIQKHGGDIWYEATENGSNFVFTLPCD